MDCCLLLRAGPLPNSQSCHPEGLVLDRRILCSVGASKIRVVVALCVRRRNARSFVLRAQDDNLGCACGPGERRCPIRTCCGSDERFSLLTPKNPIFCRMLFGCALEAFGSVFFVEQQPRRCAAEGSPSASGPLDCLPTVRGEANVVSTSAIADGLRLALHPVPTGTGTD